MERLHLDGKIAMQFKKSLSSVNIEFRSGF
jgi:hypothetical protein